MLRAPTQTRGRPRLPWVTIGLAALCAALFVAFGDAPAALVYDRAAIADGELWRLATGHLVHLDLQHLGYNIGALVALGALYETASFGGPRRLMLGVLGLGGAAVTATLLAASPETLQYCGLSAVLNTLYAAVTLGLWRETRQPLWLAAFFADVAKIAIETAFGPIFSSGLAWPPLPAAHIAGLAAGCMLLHIAVRHRRPERHPRTRAGGTRGPIGDLAAPRRADARMYPCNDNPDTMLAGMTS